MEDVEPTEAPEAVEDPTVVPDDARIYELAKAVVRALTSGSGRGNRCQVEELPELLTADGINFDPDELSEVLARLEDVGLIVRVQNQPPSPLFLVLNWRDSKDQAGALAAAVCTSIKARGDQCESDHQLMCWLDEDRVSYTSESLSAACITWNGLAGSSVLVRISGVSGHCPGCMSRPGFIQRSF
jgi:hypothetical protein